MYTLMLKRNFNAQHFLIGKDWGAENHPHSHHYGLELEMECSSLDQHNYLLDIVDVQQVLETHAAYFKDKILNHLPEFKNQNPSLELFTKVLWEKFKSSLQWSQPTIITVRLWEDTIARASYRSSTT